MGLGCQLRAGSDVIQLYQKGKFWVLNSKCRQAFVVSLRKYKSSSNSNENNTKMLSIIWKKRSGRVKGLWPFFYFSLPHLIHSHVLHFFQQVYALVCGKSIINSQALKST